MVPIVLAMANDNVPNVRFNVVKTLKKIGLIFPQKYVSLKKIYYLNKYYLRSSMNTFLFSDDVKSKIKLVLDELNVDTDVDVRYFAAEALTVIPWN